MATRRISQLPAADPLDGTEETVVVQGGVTKRALLPAGGGGGADAIARAESPFYNMAVAWDNFDRPAGALGDADSGHAWQAWGDRPLLNVGAGFVASGSDGAAAVVETGVTSCRIVGLYRPTFVSSNRTQFIVAANDTHALVWGPGDGTNSWSILEWDGVALTSTGVGSSSVVPDTGRFVARWFWTEARVYIFSTYMRAIGMSTHGQSNQVTLSSLIDTTLFPNPETATKKGMRLLGGNRIGSFIVQDLGSQEMVR